MGTGQHLGKPCLASQHHLFQSVHTEKGISAALRLGTLLSGQYYYANKVLIICKTDLLYNFLFFNYFNYSKQTDHPKDMPWHCRGNATALKTSWFWSQDFMKIGIRIDVDTNEKI